MDIHDATVDIALAEARAGRFGQLAEELRRSGAHPKIVAWIAGGCRTGRRIGRPQRDPAIEQQVDLYYREHRDRIPPEDLSEKALILTIADWFHLDEREVRRIVKERRRESVARGALEHGISETEAGERWDAKREARWNEWRAMKVDPDTYTDDESSGE